MDPRMIELAEDVAAFKVGLASVADKLDELSHRLLGNGEPGVIADLQASDKALSERMDKFENRTHWLTCVWVGASAVVVRIFAVLKFVFHREKGSLYKVS
jgi:hypothetical protein